MSERPYNNAKGFSDLVSNFVKSEDYRDSVLPNFEISRLTDLFNLQTLEPRIGAFGGFDDQALLGTTFWQLYTKTKVFQRTIGSHISGEAEFVISNNGNGDGQYVLIILDPFFESKHPKVYEVMLREDDMDDSIHEWIKNYALSLNVVGLKNSPFDHYRLLNDNKLHRDLRHFAFQVAQNQKFQIVHMHKPTSQLIQCLRSNECLGLRTAGPHANISTVGVITENSQGQKGFTMALHATDNQSDIIFIDDIACKIVSRDPVSDSCFVVPESEEILLNSSATNGPLIGKTPRGYQTAEFNGLTSGKRKTIIDSWSKDLPFVEPYNQLKVFTKDIASPGDSGSALIDDENNVVGFAFYISGFDAPVDFTAWIWAASVFKAHNLKS